MSKWRLSISLRNGCSFTTNWYVLSAYRMMLQIICFCPKFYVKGLVKGRCHRVGRYNQRGGEAPHSDLTSVSLIIRKSSTDQFGSVELTGIHRRAPFLEGYKFREKSKSTFSWKLFSRINIFSTATTYMIMINSCIYVIFR